MSGKSNHEADIQNGNQGTRGTNATWDHAQGNRGKQLNPNQQQVGNTGSNAGVKKNSGK